VETDLFRWTEKLGFTSGILTALPEDIQTEAIIDLMVSEAISTSGIEGEYLSREDVKSSIKNNLGLTEKPLPVKDKKAAGAGKLMTDVRISFKQPLTTGKLYSWHSMLMGESRETKVGAWRTHEEPMQVISGAMGKQKVHYKAPPSARVPEEMDKFITWFNETGPGGVKEIKTAPVRSSIAHLYFETIHPFEDGNGRIGRAIAEKALSQGIGRPVFLSLSATIEANKKAYYDALEKAQRSNEMTKWVSYFVKTVLDAQTRAEELIGFTLLVTKFFDRYKDRLNDRQNAVIRRMLEEGPVGFKGGMNARKYVSITKTSKATATRDMQELLEMGAFILLGDGRGRSTNYQVTLPSAAPSVHPPNPSAHPSLTLPSNS
jgi:Fic family protein